MPMGKHKLDHVWALLSHPPIAERWRAAHGALPDQETLHRMYSGFAALQAEVLKTHLDLIPGVAETTAELTRRGIRFSSTTGFETNMMDDVKRAAAEQGYHPEHWVCPDMVGGGRPAPWMIHYAAKQMNLYPLHTFVKVGDTEADIGEAKNAGTWCVSVVRSGNEIGLTAEALAALTEDERAGLIAAAEAKFLGLGAHYVIDTVANLLPVLDEIAGRIAKGERP